MSKRIKVEGRTGVFYRIARRVGHTGTEKVYYVTYKQAGRKIEVKAGRQYRDRMTPAKAERYRARLIDGLEMTPQEKRKAQLAAAEAAKGRYTIGRLWTEYMAGRKPGKSFITDRSRYRQYLKPLFSDLEPHEILPLDVERLKRRLLKTKSPQTVKHVLNLLTIVINFGVKNGLCPGLTFHVKKPTVHNTKTEDLSPTQLKKLLNVIDDHHHPIAGNLMKMALFTGMRRGEMFKLKWDHIDFERGFISIVDPKGGPSQIIPMNKPARELLSGIDRNGSTHVFPGRGDSQLSDISGPLNDIKKKADLPADFRPLHGLRHTFASQLASSGQVDLYTLQKLMTHKNPNMTMRYAHLRDATLKQASELAGDIVTNLAGNKKVVNLKK